MRKQLVVGFDLDGVLCEEVKASERQFARPLNDSIRYLNSLSDKGVYIFIFTARPWSDRRMTEYWLDDNGVRYHSLVMGKPQMDYFVDDRSFNSVKALEEELAKYDQ